MSKRKNISQEFIDDSDDPDDEGVKSKKKAKKQLQAAASERGIGAALLNKKSKSDIDEDDLIPLSAKRFCNVRSFRGKIMVDIREYYQDDCGELRPGKKGISLSLDQWKKLKDSMDAIEERIQGLG